MLGSKNGIPLQGGNEIIENFIKDLAYDSVISESEIGRIEIKPRYIFVKTEEDYKNEVNKCQVA